MKKNNNMYLTKKMDKLGRVVIPKPYTKILDIHENDLVDIALSSDRDELILRKHDSSINYENIIRKCLTVEKGIQDHNFHISKNEIQEFKELILSFTESLVDSQMKK